MNINYFVNVTCIEELKKVYKELVFKFHPDVSKIPNCSEIMKAINNQYEKLFKKLKDIHKNKEGKTYESTKKTDETYEVYRDILNLVVRFHNCKVELIGTWLWVSGDTKPYKDELKKLKFSWSPNKSAWFYHYGDYQKKNNIKYSMNDIRNMWGTKEYEQQPMTGIE